MTDLGYADPAQARRDPEIPAWLIIALVLVMLAGAGLVAYVVLGMRADRDKGPSYPKAWDTRILPYVRIAERERELTFEHPVAVRFLSPTEFEKTVRVDDKDLDKGDRKEIEQFTGMMRAVGLIEGDVDLFKAFNDAHGSGTLAYYSFDDQRITIRGTTITPAMKSTLVHELTHALQDQRFGLGATMRRVGKAQKKWDTTEDDVLSALAEGDAERIEAKYHDSLSPTEQKALDKAREKETDDADKGMKGVPVIVQSLIGAPYALGEALLEAVDRDGGTRAVDNLFRDAPAHDDALLDPFTVLLGGHDKVAKLHAPAVAKGEKEFDKGEYGAISWYFTLAERLPLRDALTAVDGWGGDAYVAFERGETACVRADLVGRDKDATARLLGALRHWVAAAPGTPASVKQVGTRLRFESCDPGRQVHVGRQASADAIELAAVRTYLGLNLHQAGAGKALARCVAGELVQAYSVRQLENPRFGDGSGAVQRRVAAMAADCRART